MKLIGVEFVCSFVRWATATLFGQDTKIYISRFEATATMFGLNGKRKKGNENRMGKKEGN